MRLLSVVLIVLAAVALADASNTVRQQIIVPAQGILVPSYGGSYGQGQPQQLNDDLLRRLVEVLERLEARDTSGNLSAESVMRTDCAKCHTEGAAKGGFILFGRDSKPVDLSIGDKKLVELRITSNDPKQRMPPEKSLSQAKQSIVIETLKKGGQ